jgi:hypothetical protein
VFTSYSMKNTAAPVLDRDACEEARYTFPADIDAHLQCRPIHAYPVYFVCMLTRCLQKVIACSWSWIVAPIPCLPGKNWPPRRIRRQTSGRYLHIRLIDDSKIIMKRLMRARIASLDHWGLVVCTVCVEVSVMRISLIIHLPELYPDDRLSYTFSWLERKWLLDIPFVVMVVSCSLTKFTR